MILGRAWALALFAVPLLLLWLRFRAARPRAAEASSLLVWRKVSSSDTPAGRPRPPLSAWLEAAGAALVVLALADPALVGAAPPAVRVLLDTSVSMRAKGGDGGTRLEAARAALAGSGAAIQESAHPGADLPALLAAGGPLVVVTDHRLPGFADDPPRLRVVGVGERGFNAAILAAGGGPGGEGRWRVFVTIAAWGQGGPVAGTLEWGGRTRTLTLAPGASLQVEEEFALPDDGRVEATLAFPGDGCSADDQVRLWTAGGRPVTLQYHGREVDAPFERAMAAAGARLIFASGLGLAHPGSYDIIAGDALGTPAMTVRFPDEAGGEEVGGATVVAGDHPVVSGVAVDPTVTLGRRSTTPPRGTPVLSDENGPLITVQPRDGSHRFDVEFGFQPGGTWTERDPSFVVLCQNLVDLAARGPLRLDADGVLDPAESREAAEGEAFGDLPAALREAAEPDPASRRPLALGLLLAGGALLAGAWVAAR